LQKDIALTNILRKMSKKGFYETLKFIGENPAHYADILSYALKNKIVKSRATVTVILNTLTSLELTKRTLVDAKPIRTRYEVTEKGMKLLQLLRQMEQVVSTATS